MQLIKTYKLILCLAAILFIARPFIGFSVLDQFQSKEETNLFVKIFSKRKPEFFEDAVRRFAEIKQLLKTAAFQLTGSFALLLAILFASLLAFMCSPFNRLFVTDRRSIGPSNPIYLLTRQLTI